jgi:hypothetical protein
MSAIITDVIRGDISPVVCNAAVNAGGKLLKVVEMQFKYGVPGDKSSERELTLCPSLPTTNGVEDRVVMPEKRRKRA